MLHKNGFFFQKKIRNFGIFYAQNIVENISDIIIVQMSRQMLDLKESEVHNRHIAELTKGMPV